MQLLMAASWIQNGVNSSFAAATFHLTLQWAPVSVTAKRVKWKNPPAGVALLIV
jgi:hypothetical protein